MKELENTVKLINETQKNGFIGCTPYKASQNFDKKQKNFKQVIP